MSTPAPPSSSPPASAPSNAASTTTTAATASPPPPAPTAALVRFPLATPPDVIRAAQKDDYYVAMLRNSMAEVVASTLGSREYARLSKYLGTAASTLYYALTTGLGQSTLGEEYCDIVPTTADASSVPARWSRFLFVLSQSVLPAFLQHWLAGATPGSKRAHLASAISSLLPLHLAVFYFTGAYYTLAKRISGIRYLSLTKPTDEQANFSYAPLGRLLLVQILTTGGLTAYRAWRAWRRDRAVAKAVLDDDSVPLLLGTEKVVPAAISTTLLPYESTGDCVLCMCPRDVSTAGPCGHLFCWTCVCEWLKEKPECPLCRTPCFHRDLICVNY
ncbi:hypothetical protein AMAG_12108 [Allomyces macrogynus ATCC 38327]|uniref:RING-type E3 ubiquitin transferase n=1 Tax=Allomyces macrogynus (strain ATCC 38327) TaxID=578462 RepID=A0A0L0SX30_ALLM3|nr:hypothetical protein AMAG_12108 [Allomyces macrogynus ATCC 38327]|eukprot:KNE67031.1 hypothetical protein AMAG_12108 [Allomyces macrogynus ATCC 38327]